MSRLAVHYFASTYQNSLHCPKSAESFGLMQVVMERSLESVGFWCMGMSIWLKMLGVMLKVWLASLQCWH